MDLRAADLAHSFHPQTNLALHASVGPLTIARGEGVWLETDDGRRLLDGMAGLWCVGLGYSERRLVAAATRQLETLPYQQSFGHRAHEPGIRLAADLAAIAPAGLTRAFFATSGSEAVDSAVKLAWYFWNARSEPGRKRILARRRAYHGVTVAAGSLTGLPGIHGGFDLPRPFAIHLTAPHAAQQARPGESEAAFTARLADELEAVIAAEGAETIAAMIAEPLIGAGGVILPPAGYFAAIQPILRRHGILLIADEVITGFGRTGRMWGCETFDMVPDMLVCAKQLTSGYQPLSALMVSEAIYATVAEESGRRGSFGHGFTYGGHPVACAVARETLALYRERDIVGAAAAKAPRFQRRLAALNQVPGVREARGIGLIGGVEMADAADAARVQAAALWEGLIVRAVVDTVAICPPLVIGDAEIDLLFDRLEAALRSV
ncbi:aminotransferase [Sandaracinobacteroides saxicola]|uniref:Aminotransferase class III-fold pyridoxal phosphate-dependent enzyme n=1 Tax=Sandaracinobacteroides saxicola TaxID=2759707 RepID=A0A7G5IFK6_9SPHN|nr:aminotransferase [Sandaracinobacteroides saxicola]QMW22148.1 aminotransferase class III-fold pyridoxal phosphate-dependent enzyme [Sandaracinobacteroides saxicola]